MATGKNQRLYDIKEYADKVKAALTKLEQEQKPGEQQGKGGKTDVLLAAKDEIQKLIDRGYTAKQISDAFQKDVFGILPKTITQLFATVRKPKRTKQVAQPTTEEPTSPISVSSPVVAGRKTLSEPGSFKIKPDTKDL